MQDAIKMATVNPAKVIGVDDRKGSLTRGKDADIVVLDEGLSVIMTLVEGRVVYENWL